MNLLVGYGIAMEIGVLGLYRANRPHLLAGILAALLYWMLISCAAYAALVCFAISPFKLEKTLHRGTSAVSGTDSGKPAARRAIGNGQAQMQAGGYPPQPDRRPSPGKARSEIFLVRGHFNKDGLSIRFGTPPATKPRLRARTRPQLPPPHPLKDREQCSEPRRATVIPGCDQARAPCCLVHGPVFA